MRFTINIRIHPTMDSDSTDSDPIATFTDEIEALEPALATIEQQIARIESQMRMAPLDRPIQAKSAEFKAWCKSKGLEGGLTLKRLVEAILHSAIVCDVSTRTLRLTRDDALLLSEGRETVSFFDVLRGLTTLLS